MSTEEPRRRSLAEWIRALVDAVDIDPVAGPRLRAVAGAHTAIVGLDDERVFVAFDPLGRLVVRPPEPDDEVDGRGWTSRAAVRRILAGALDATDAVTTGLVHVEGSPGRVLDLLHVIELLLDAATRLPDLRRLADALLGEAAPDTPESSDGLVDTTSAEADILARLGLLP